MDVAHRAGPFAYWEGIDRSPIEPFLAHWREAFPSFRVLGDPEVLGLLETHFPREIDLYRAIRLPTPKSDLARYLALYQEGGLYVDCHMGIKDAAAIERLLGELDRVEAVFVTRSKALPYPIPPDSRPLIAGILFGRPRLQIFLDVVRQALANLAWQRRRELEHGFVPYSLFHLVGPGLLSAMINQPGSEDRELRWDLQDRVRILCEEEAPIQRNVFRSGYAALAPHWSVRQESEPLFTR
jgi:hypothetical protein